MGREHKRHVNKYGFTRLAEACENGDLDAVKEWLEKDHEQLEISEFAGNSPLQIASLNGYPDIVKFLIDSGCNKDCANIDNDTPLIDSVENGHSDVVRVLLEAGVNPLHQNRKGQQALDVITDQTEDASEIREMLKKAIEERQQKGLETSTPAEAEEERTDRLGPKQGLHFMARNPDNLLKLVANNDRKGVIEFINARVTVDNNIVAAAAKTGDLYVLNLLLADMTPWKMRQKAEKPMLAALGTSHFEAVKILSELENFDPLWRSKANGQTWYELAEARSGPHWKQERELLHRLYTEAAKSRGLSSSPISDFKNSRRHKSPAPSKASDTNANVEEEDEEEDDSPDVAPTKRRLMSRKDMRAATIRKSPSPESSRPASSPEAPMKPNGEEESKMSRRKPGRPRTKSLSSQSSEIKTKRIKATRENIALFDSSQATSNKTRKPSNSSTSRPAAESVAPVKKSSSNDEDAIIIDQKADQKQRAEEARKEAEELARREDEAARKKQEEELARRKEEADAARKLAVKQVLAEKRQEKLETFPSALRYSIEASGISPRKIARYLSQHFLPLQAVYGGELGLPNPCRDVAWMLNYQAAGILRSHAGDELIELPNPNERRPGSLLEDILHFATSPMQREAVLKAIGPVNLAHHLPDPFLPSDSSAPDTGAAKSEAARVFHERIAKESEKFLALDSLAWIKVGDFLAIKAGIAMEQAEIYPHLKYMPPMEVAFATSFEPLVGGIPPPVEKRPNGWPDPAADVVEPQVRSLLGKGLREGDGRTVCMYKGAIKKTTPVSVVVDD